MIKLVKRTTAFILILLTVPIFCTFTARLVPNFIQAGAGKISLAPNDLLQLGKGEKERSAAAFKNKGQDCQTFLITGIDEKENSPYMIALAKIKQGDKAEATILYIPCDTYIRDEKYPFHKIKQIYGYAYDKCKESGKKDADAINAGNRELCAFIEQAFCAEVDYYFCIADGGIEKIVDSLGGIDLVTTESNRNNKNHIDGKEAEKLIRTEGEPQIEIHKALFCALLNKVKSGLTFSETLALSRALYSNVKTNMPLSKLPSPSAFKAGAGKVTFNFIRFDGRRLDLEE